MVMVIAPTKKHPEPKGEGNRAATPEAPEAGPASAPQEVAAAPADQPQEAQ
jgi:hypothetical protein